MFLKGAITDRIEDFATGSHVQVLSGNKPISDATTKDGKQPHGQIWKGRYETIL